MSNLFLKLQFCDGPQHKKEDEFHCRAKPFQSSDIFSSTIQQFKKLTQGGDVKSTYELILETRDQTPNFLPGDTIAILPQNDEKEVFNLLRRLHLDAVSEKFYRLKTVEKSTKKLPPHIPVQGTLFNTFLKFVDIRSVPKKVFLKSLLSYTTDETDKQKLELICSPSGSKHYEAFISKNRTLLQILEALPSCCPPVEIILQHSMSLKPRYFSITCPQTDEGNTISIIFSVMEFENKLKGICTGWLEKLMEKDCFNSEKTIPFYFRTSTGFQISKDLRGPKIFIAIGTGIAPFMSFLRDSNIKNQNIWLFYGCRYNVKDFLCKDEILQLSKSGVMKLNIAFSREQPKKHYVEDEILKNSEEFVNFLLNQEQAAKVYICGSSKMSEDARKTILQCIALVQKDAAEEIFNKLDIYVDSWL